MATYRVTTGLEFGDKRYEAGDFASDIPTKSVSWLTEQGLIELVEDTKKSKKQPVEVVEEPLAEEV